jgi:hypothetical protein
MVFNHFSAALGAFRGPFFQNTLSLRPALAVVLYQAIAFVGPDCLNGSIFYLQVTILLIKRWSFSN